LLTFPPISLLAIAYGCNGHVVTTRVTTSQPYL